MTLANAASMTVESPTNLCSSQGPTASPMEEETPVDALASNAFDEVPQQDIGYFGPSSNHALFRTLSSAFANQIPLMLHTEGSVTESAQALSNNSLMHLAESPTTVRRPDNRWMQVDRYALPHESEMMRLTNRFFTTIGIVVPYIDRSALLPWLQASSHSRRPRLWSTSRPARALINIICAHAALTLQSPDAEAFYRRTLALLDELTLRGSSIELVQALLLLCIFQQNTQRSIASWTYHALVIKAAYQLGLHARASHEEHGTTKRELFERIWQGVFIQDVCLSAALGRPCIIPTSYLRPESWPNPLTMMESVPGYSRSHFSGFTYHHILFSLHKLKANVIETLFDSNMGSHKITKIPDAVGKRIQLICDLETWRASFASYHPILDSSETEDGLSPTSYEADHFRLLLSVNFHSICMLANNAVLSALLIDNHMGTTAQIPLLAEATLAIEHDLSTSKKLSELIGHLCEFAPTFIDTNACWWFCNYNSKNYIDNSIVVLMLVTVFTVCLHLFGILLLCHGDQSAQIRKSVDPIVVRETLNSGLKILETVERTSLMSRKGRRCLERFLQVLDSRNGSHRLDSGLHSDRTAVQDNVPAFDDHFAQLVTQSADNFIWESSQLGFLDSDFSWNDLSLGA
ncbi:fungal-specific transcription factor domain-containing protein [Lophiotrema nucula]|uniref:Fungal-specific transcription factor domain-containing protein n=1 Tax=Lophiotrema nucula TaxID=690887 RepID=A0A6A5YJN8_9PLEO|nr:fungal-specific transcription factor domain-containing protein [Lophiotrema nucula]